MKIVRNIILGIIGFAAVCIMTFYPILLPIGWSFLGSQPYMGEADDEKTAKFDEYYNDFAEVKDLALVEYENAGGKSMPDLKGFFYVEEGRSVLKTNIYIKGGHFAIRTKWLEVSDTTKLALKRLSDYFGSEIKGIEVAGNRLIFNQGKQKIAYMSDDTIPTYTNSSGNEFVDYAIFKLRENWYYIYIAR
jgi:hypothetical protein